MHRPGQSGRHSGAIGSASWIASRTGGLQVELVVVGQAGDIGLVVVASGLPVAEIERGKVLLLEVHRDREFDVAQAAAALEREGGLEVGEGDDPAVGVEQADAAVDRSCELEVLAEVDRRVVDLEMTLGSRGVAEEPGDVPGEGRARGADRGHRGVSTGSPASSSQRLSVAVLARRPVGDQGGAPAVQEGDPVLDATRAS